MSLPSSRLASNSVLKHEISQYLDFRHSLRVCGCGVCMGGGGGGGGGVCGGRPIMTQYILHF